MPELIWILDPTTGDLVVEGLEAEEALALAGDLLPVPEDLNCARPLQIRALPEFDAADGPSLRVAGLWHASVVEGPGRRSVLACQGCNLGCRGCFVPQTHPFDSGAVVPVDALVQLLLDPSGEPRDGVSVLGGEPFLQPVGLAALLGRIKARGVHTTVYTGYTLEALGRRPEPTVRAALELTDLLIDGPFVASLSQGAGEWRGSRNQRLIAHPSTVLSSMPNAVLTP